MVGVKVQSITPTLDEELLASSQYRPWQVTTKDRGVCHVTG
jgi:hypothetical protein